MGDSIAQMVGRKVRIAHRHSQAGMPENLLQREDIAAVLDKVAGKGVPESVTCLPFW